MSDVFFVHQGAGSGPERVTLRIRNGLVELTVRGEPTIASVETVEKGWHEVVTPGPTAVMAMPPDVAMAMAQALLRVAMPIDSPQAVPFVLFFETVEARDAYAARILSEQPEIVAIGQGS